MFVLRLLSLAPLALATVLPHEEAINYDGYRVYRIATAGNDSSVTESLSALDYEQWNLNSGSRRSQGIKSRSSKLLA